jgi:integrase
LTVYLTVYEGENLTKRREKGDGSVYERSDGRCVGEYDDAYGKRRYVSGKNKAEVRAKLRKLLADKEEGIAYDCENLTVELYLERWLASMQHTVRPSTYERYCQLLRLHVVPTLGKVRLSRVNALQVQSLYRSKLDEELSTNTVRKVHVALFTALKQAVRWQLLRSNVCESVTPPKEAQCEIKPLSKEQVKALLQAAEQTNLYALWLLAVTSGMRESEILALAWDCVDLNAGTVHVRRTVWKGKVYPPKSPRSQRTIQLSQKTICTLKEHKAKQKDSQWCFPNQVGKPMDRHGFINRKWKRLVKDAGLPHSTRFHDLRHNCCVMLLMAGINPRVVSDQLGHSDVAFTLRRYATWLSSMHGGTGEVMDQSIS